MITETDQLCEKHRARLSNSTIGDKTYYRCTDADDPCFGEVTAESKTESPTARQEEPPPRQVSPPVQRRSSQPTEYEHNGGLNEVALNGNGHRESFYETVLKPQVSAFDDVEHYQLEVSYAVMPLIKAGKRDFEDLWFEVARMGIKPPATISQTDASELMDGVIRRCLQPIEVEDEQSEILPWEDFDGAVVANEEYLKRIAVVDKLCYSHAVSMITGGKHAGKSTLARWAAICVVKGWSFLGRETHQGGVFYIASEDETMAARQELIRLGWNRDDRLRFLSASKLGDADPVVVLERLSEAIAQFGTVLVVLDMLFDFVRISNEISYAETREAVGRIQQVASKSGAHVIAIHHAPKNAHIGDAAVAALGSQGLAARVSPIILVRRFGPNVHSVSSTTVRDPRGQELPESRLVRQPDGSVELGGAWKNYMLAEVYMGRVMELLEAEPGAEMTAPEIAEQLEITYEVARSCLVTMVRNGLAVRTGKGKKGQPFRYALLISATNAVTGEAIFPTPTGEVGYSSEGEIYHDPNEQGRFGYKD